MHFQPFSTIPKFLGAILLANDIENQCKEGQSKIGGMDIQVSRNFFGRQIQSFEEPLHVQSLGKQPFPGVFIRAPAILSVGPSVEVLAELCNSKHGKVIVAVKQGNCRLATVFHPELTSDTRFHELFMKLVRISAQQKGKSE